MAAEDNPVVSGRTGRRFSQPQIERQTDHFIQKTEAMHQNAGLKPACNMRCFIWDLVLTITSPMMLLLMSGRGQKVREARHTPDVFYGVAGVVATK